MNLLQQLNGELNAFFTPRPAVKGETKTRWIAVFACGHEAEIKRNRYDRSFTCIAPNGENYETSLGDIKYFLAQDFPGVKFKRVAL